MAGDSRAVDLRVRMSGARGAAKDADRVSRSVRGIGDSAHKAGNHLKFANSMSRSFSAGLRTIGSVGAVGIAALGTEIVHATKNWADHQAIVRRTNAVIKSTQGAANVSTKHINNLTDSIERQTGVDGDLAQQGANLLLTFTNVRNGVGKSNQIFDQATKTTVNMSKALGQDTKSSAIQLGKALNDPVKGITALSRVGVSFTDQQKDQIKQLVKSGKTMEAQKIILRELGREFPKVKATPFERLQAVLRQLEDTIGKQVLPIFNKFVTWVTPHLQKVADAAELIFDNKKLNWSQKIQRLMDVVKKEFGPMAGKILQALKDAHLDDKLRAAFEWAAPKISQAFATMAPKALTAFWNAFTGMGTGGKLVTLGFLASKLGLTSGLFNNLGSARADNFGTGFRGKLAKGAKAALPVGALIGAGITGKNVSRAQALLLIFMAYQMAGPYGAVAMGGYLGATWLMGKLPNHNYNPHTSGSTTAKTDPQYGGPRPLNTRVLTPPQQPLARPIPNRYIPPHFGHRASGGMINRAGVYEVGERGSERVWLPAGAMVEPHGAGSEIVIHNHISLDGKQIATSVHRQAVKAKSLR